MAAFRLPAPPGRVGSDRAPRPALTFIWRLDAAGQLTRRWQAVA